MGEGSVAPSLSSLTPKLGGTLWKIPTHISGRDHICNTGSVFSPALGSAHLPLSVAEVLLGGAVLVVPVLQHFFFFPQLFLLCLIEFGFVSARRVCTHFLFSSSV